MVSAGVVVFPDPFGHPIDAPGNDHRIDEPIAAAVGDVIVGEAKTRMITALSYVSAGYLENRLVTAVNAAEGLHRSLYPGLAMLPRDFDRILASARSEMEAEDFEWLNSRVRNEPSLQTRLLDIAERVDEGLQMQLIADQGEWAKRATQARNSLVHREEEGRLATQLKSMGTERLGAIADTTIMMVTIAVLIELGLPAPTVQQIAGGNSRLQGVRRRAADHLVRSWPLGQGLAVAKRPAAIAGVSAAAGSLAACVLLGGLADEERERIRE